MYDKMGKVDASVFIFFSRHTYCKLYHRVFCVGGWLAGFGEAGRECCCRRFHSGVEREREALGALFGKDEAKSIISG